MPPGSHAIRNFGDDLVALVRKELFPNLEEAGVLVDELPEGQVWIAEMEPALTSLRDDPLHERVLELLLAPVFYFFPYCLFTQGEKLEAKLDSWKTERNT